MLLQINVVAQYNLVKMVVFVQKDGIGHCVTAQPHYIQDQHVVESLLHWPSMDPSI